MRYSCVAALFLTAHGAALAGDRSMWENTEKRPTRVVDPGGTPPFLQPLMRALGGMGGADHDGAGQNDWPDGGPGSDGTNGNFNGNGNRGNNNGNGNSGNGNGNGNFGSGHGNGMSGSGIGNGNVGDAASGGTGQDNRP